MYGSHKDPRQRSGVDLIFGPGRLENAETNRRDVRDRLVGPLKAAMGNLGEEGNQDIKNMKRVLWGV